MSITTAAMITSAASVELSIRSWNLCHLLGDDDRHVLSDRLGRTTGLHRHPVENVGSFHRLLLVGHDEKLGPLSEFVDDTEKAAQVGGVEGSLHFVQDIEGAWSGFKHCKEERQGCQAPLATREQPSG